MTSNIMLAWSMQKIFDHMENNGCFRKSPTPMPTGYAKALAEQNANKDK